MALLLVEDEDDVRIMIADYLRDEGHEVVEAADTVQAKRLMATGTPAIDLVVTDVRMPGEENGVQLAEYIHRNYPAVRVLIASGNVTDAEIGGELFIMKPFKLDRLGAMVRGILHDRR